MESIRVIQLSELVQLNLLFVKIVLAAAVFNLFLSSYSTIPRYGNGMVLIPTYVDNLADSAGGENSQGSSQDGGLVKEHIALSCAFLECEKWLEGFEVIN